jgi:alkaline phosphatase
VGAGVAIGGKHHSRTWRVSHDLHDSKPKNIIFFLGDGMGTQEITAARYYQYGAAGHMNIDNLIFTGFDKTWSLKPGAGPNVSTAEITDATPAVLASHMSNRACQGPTDSASLCASEVSAPLATVRPTSRASRT